MSLSMEQKYAAETRVPQVLAGSLIPFGLASFVVLARFYTRGVLIRNWSSDDSYVLVSWILGIVLVVLHCLLTNYGTGHHQSTMSVEDFEKTYMLAFAIKIVYQIILGTTKIAICGLFLCIFQDTKGRRIVYGMVAFIVLFTTALLLASIFQCSPIERAWKLNTPGICASYLGPLVASGICNIIVNALLIILITPRVLKLNIHRRQKVALLAVVNLGFLAIIATIVRIFRIIRFISSSDASWDGSDATTWSALEVSTGLFCVSAPALRPFFRQFRGVSSLLTTQSPPTSACYTKKPNPRALSQSGGISWNNEDALPHQTNGSALNSIAELVALPSQTKLSSQAKRQQHHREQNV